MSRADNSLMDELAEHVAEGATLTVAARRMKITSFKRDWLWGRICARLGRQAQ